MAFPFDTSIDIQRNQDETYPGSTGIVRVGVVSMPSVGNNDSVGPLDVPAPTSGTLAAGVDPSGDLKPLKVNSSGELITSKGAGGFSTLASGYPKQVTIGTTSALLLPANPLRAYAHIFNNSSDAIYIQYSVSAALNQGIKIGPGCFFTLDTDNLWLGDVNGIGLTSSQIIDCLEGE